MKTLLIALHKAQKEFEPLRRNTENAFTKGKYADLSAVLDAIQQPLLDNGLLVVQLPHTYADDQGRLWVDMVTTLYHAESGESLTNTLPMPVAKADPQGIGSACTYSRRYALMAMFGLAPEDDDGNSASTPAQERKAPQRKPAPQEVPQKRNGTQERPQAQASAPAVPVQRSDLWHDIRRHLDMLGEELYNEQWQSVRKHNTERMTGGATADADDLNEEQLQKMLNGLKKLKRQRQPPSPAELAEAEPVAF